MQLFTFKIYTMKTCKTLVIVFIAMITFHTANAQSDKTERTIGIKTEKVKVLGTGELTSKVNVSVHAISETAKQKIEALGGTVTIVK